MGGHSAWRKRIKRGLLAKEGGGGAICRHHPRLGRRGKDLILNRKGYIKGGSNKKKKIRERRGTGLQLNAGSNNNHTTMELEEHEHEEGFRDDEAAVPAGRGNSFRVKALRILLVFMVAKVYRYIQRNKST